MRSNPQKIDRPTRRTDGSVNGTGSHSVKARAPMHQWQSGKAPQRPGPGPKPSGSKKVTPKNTTNLR